MRNWIWQGALALVCLGLCLGFAGALLVYSRPMEDAQYDLSLMWEGEAMPEDWVYDQKGWTVFVQEGDRRKVLQPDGLGGFSGLTRPGQTLYFSRALTEKLDSPVLRLGVANRAVAVFLDEDVLYTDAPEQDNAIGSLALSPLEADRTEPLMISLPHDYENKTLTIAQSTDQSGLAAERTQALVYPCSVTLYCGYAYESGLISEGVRAVIPAALAFGAGVILLFLFLWQGSRGKWDPGLPAAALAAFLAQCACLAAPSFAMDYLDRLALDVGGLSRLFLLATLLAFLASRQTGVRRNILWAFAGVQGVVSLVQAVPEIDRAAGFVWRAVPEAVGLLGLAAALVCGGLAWREREVFARFFCPLVLAGALAGLVCTLLSDGLGATILQQFSLGALGFFLWPLMALVLTAALLAAISTALRQEVLRRAEEQEMEAQKNLAQASFENLRQHNEEVMMLRHDMMRHFRFLRQSTQDPETAAYLDRLIGQQQTAVRPVIQSRNLTLDLILNASLAQAAAAGIQVEVVRADAPARLPLTEPELCPLIMNIMDNAVAAAADPAVERPFLRLDLHQKDGFFVFSCENARGPDAPQAAKKETVPKHGLGQKIIREIMARHGDLVETETGADFYRITLAFYCPTPADTPAVSP